MVQHRPSPEINLSPHILFLFSSTTLFPTCNFNVVLPFIFHRTMHHCYS